MKFDVVVGNPPFSVGGKNKTIWHIFVKKSFDLCKEGGFVSLIHPIGWRNVQTKRSRFKDVRKILINNNLLVLKMYDVKSGKDIFKKDTPFDWYVSKKEKYNGLTNIIYQNNMEEMKDISEMSFIPNLKVDLFDKLIAKNGEDTVEILHSESLYETRKKHMSKEKTNLYKYPCIYSVLKDGITLKYSKTNNLGHFNIPKLILGNGANPTLFLDLNGDYGMTQFAFGIVDTPENLIRIKNVLESGCLNDITMSTKYVATQGNPIIYHKILSFFKKDFWKEFIDD